MMDGAVGQTRLRGGWWARAGEIYAAALFSIYALLILLHHDPPSLGDFGDLIYQGVVLRDHLLGLPDAFHVVKRYPVPNGAVTAGIGVLAVVLPWNLAAKIWLCLQLGLSFFALRIFMRGRRRNGAIFVLIPTAVFLNLNFWYGFLNFELGLCWAVLLAAYLLRGARREWICGALLLLGFFSHMVAFAFMGTMLLAYAVQRPARRRLLRQLLPPAVASAWYLLGRFLIEGNADGRAGMVSAVTQFSGLFWAYKVNSFMKSLGFINLGTHLGSTDVEVFGAGWYLALFLVNACVCSLVVYCMVRAMRASFARRGQERFVWVAALVFVPIYLVAPAAALGISDPGSRVLEAALAVALLMCGRSRALRMAAACSVVLAGSSLLLLLRVGYRTLPVQGENRHVPGVVLRFAHIPNHDKDLYLEALRRGDRSLWVFPTGFLLNTPSAKEPPPYEQ